MAVCVTLIPFQKLYKFHLKAAHFCSLSTFIFIKQSTIPILHCKFFFFLKLRKIKNRSSTCGILELKIRRDKSKTPIPGMPFYLKKRFSLLLCLVYDRSGRIFLAFLINRFIQRTTYGSNNIILYVPLFFDFPNDFQTLNCQLNEVCCQVKFENGVNPFICSF